MRYRFLTMVDFLQTIHHFKNLRLALLGSILIPFVFRLSVFDYSEMWHSVLPLRLIVWGSSYLLMVLLSYFALTNRVQGWKIAFSLAGILVLNQIFLKIVYRYFIPGFSERAGDELFWLAEMREYQVTGSIPMSKTAQGPGIFLLVGSMSHLFRGDYSQTLIAVAFIFGSVYVLPLFAMQYSATNSGNLALFATAISAQFDMIEYSTCLLYTSPSPRDRTRSRMPSSA